ncbi:MAG: tetratricopeptide repeat protein [Candidatus Solibacter sp.]
MRRVPLLALLAISSVIAAPRDPSWTHAAAPHFDIYSNTSADSARALAAGFERLRAFFLRQVDMGTPPAREVRVICFATRQEYNAYRLHGTADAYFVGSQSRDYIVLPASGDGDLRTAAHEYAHLLIHSGSWNLPEWLAEGIGDVVSTVRIGERETRIGGDYPGRSRTLKIGRWMPLPEVFAFSLKAQPGSERTGLFYAQSWALADLFMLSPAYSPGFPALLAALAAGVPAARAIDAVYHAPLAIVERDLRLRLARPPAALPLPAVPGTAPVIRVATLGAFEERLMLADLRLASGDLTTAAADFRTLAAERPDSAEAHASLGSLALQRGDMEAAVASWRRAVELGIADPDFCFRYAALADERGLPAAGALQRAIALRPGFDDARFKLALIEKNAGHAEAAIAQLRAMRQIAPHRLFAYWMALADCYLELNRRTDAKQAVAQARGHASDDADRKRADELVWLADTELAVQIEGGNQFRTIRVPLQAPPRNPFIEAGDLAQQAVGTLRGVACPDAGGIRILLDTPQGPLELSAADLSRVQIRNGGGEKFEFTCGPQEPRQVLVEYAPAQSLLRGLEFR